MNTVLWIVGEPGVGKTTLAKHLLGDNNYLLIDKPKVTVAGGPFGFSVAAGHYKGETFDGADTVSYNGVLEWFQYWRDTYHEVAQLTMFDGDRFSFWNVVELYQQLMVPPVLRMCCILLSGGPEVSERRKLRSEQNETWVKGRITKARNFFGNFPDRLEITCDSELAVAEIAENFLKGAPVNIPTSSSRVTETNQSNLF